MIAKKEITKVNPGINHCCHHCDHCSQIFPPKWLIELLLASQCKQEKVLKTDLLQYNAVSDGKKFIYTDSDEELDYGKTGILDPKEVSFYNLFINGVLQPATLYTVSKGVLVLNCSEPPIAGAVIILQFVKVIG